MTLSFCDNCSINIPVINYNFTKLISVYSPLLLQTEPYKAYLEDIPHFIIPLNSEYTSLTKDYSNVLRFVPLTVDTLSVHLILTDKLMHCLCSNLNKIGK